MVPLSYLLNYVIIAFVGVTSTYMFMRSVFPLRGTSALWFSYFAIKLTVDVQLYYCVGNGAAGTWVETVQHLWSPVTGILSLLVVYGTFDGDLVPVTICSVISDLFSSVCISLGRVLANIMCGLPQGTGYITPLGPQTFLTALTAMGAALCIRAPATWVLRWMRQIARRNRVAWTILAIAIIAFCVSVSQQLSSLLSLENHWILTGSVAGLIFVINGITLLTRMRELRGRERMVQACAKLAGDYDRAVRSQLEGLEQELAVFEGHEQVLGALGSQDAGVVEQVRVLEGEYRKLCAGAYCDRPALDAVLSAGARRLHSLGVSSSFTVAAVPDRVAVLATVALALLNLASEAAERMDDVRGDDVELRVRGVGDQVVFRMDVPQRWGTLWARHFLSVFDLQGAGLVRERRQGQRRVVIAVLTASEA